MLLIIDNHEFHYETENLCKMFFPKEKVTVVHQCEIPATNFVYTAIKNGEILVSANVNGNEKNAKTALENDIKENERKMAVLIYNILSSLTGICPKWGILTGIRPVKLVHSYHEKGLNDEEIKKELKEKMLVSDEKIDLMIRTAYEEKDVLSRSKEDNYSLYVSIPFCPTRCKYCSFVSHSIERTRKLVPQYLELLLNEIRETAKVAKNLKLNLLTIYIGGGTPTTLNAEQLKRLIDTIAENFDTKNVLEYTIEAGRPDTIDEEKLKVIKNSDVTRISINPQTLNDDVLKEIGRRHTTKQTIEAYNLARKVGIKNINMDLIAGLMGDSVESFKNTVDGVIKLGAENITVHTLSVKRAADLRDEGKKVHEENDANASPMVEYAQKTLLENGYEPYYLYRQKNMLESLENVGYAKKGYKGLYNVYIMDETHTILAVGAGATTKLKDHKTDKIERIFNFKFPYEYISRYDEILDRKGKIYDFFASKG